MRLRAARAARRARRFLAASLALVLLSQPALAQGDGSGAQTQAQGTADQLANLLSATASHPGVQAAAAALEAAEAQLRAARSPVRLDVSSSLTRLDADDIDLAPEIPGMQALERTLYSVNAGLSFRPFAFGDIADLVDQREIAVAQARLDLRAAITSIQARALLSAYEVQLARRGLEVSEEGAALAREALSVTELRLERGAASERELREAEAAVAEAENFALDAVENLDLAERALLQLIGSSEPPTPDLGALSLPTPEGDPVDVLRAGLQVRLAELAPRGAQRALLPTAQASYSWNLGDNDTLSVALESRTLQPSINYSHEAQGRTFPQTEIRGALTVGVAWSISPESFDQLAAAEAQLEAAQHALESARSGAELQQRALQNAVTQAERARALAETKHRDALARLEETRSRVEAGLSTALELQNDALAVTRTQLELHSASLAVLRGRLDLYEFYAVPLSATQLDPTSTPEASER